MTPTRALPCFTATARDILGLRTDKQLNDLVRSGRIRPAPPVVSGRRLWSATHLQQAALALGRSAADVASLLQRVDGGQA